MRLVSQAGHKEPLRQPKEGRNFGLENWTLELQLIVLVIVE